MQSNPGGSPLSPTRNSTQKRFREPNDGTGADPDGEHPRPVLGAGASRPESPLSAHPSQQQQQLPRPASLAAQEHTLSAHTATSPPPRSTAAPTTATAATAPSQNYQQQQRRQSEAPSSPDGDSLFHSLHSREDSPRSPLHSGVARSFPSAPGGGGGDTAPRRRSPPHRNDHDDDDDSSSADYDNNDDDDHHHHHNDDDNDGHDSDESDDSDTNEQSERGMREDKAKCYPRFTSEYAAECKDDLVPFIRQVFVQVPITKRVPVVATTTTTSTNQQQHHHHDPMQNIGAAAAAVAQESAQQQRVVVVRHELQGRFLLYGQYVYSRTLGKGTFSKVVLAEELDPSPAIQQQQLIIAGADPGHRTCTNTTLGDALGDDVGVSGGKEDANDSFQATCWDGTGARVALKVFRDSDVYREACWEEYNILSALCVHAPIHVGDGSTAVVGGSGPGSPMLLGTGNGGSGGTTAAIAPHATALTVPPMLTTMRTTRDHVGRMEFYGSLGRFMTPIDFIPHPRHPAIIYPVMGPSLLSVLRDIKKTSRELHAATKLYGCMSGGGPATTAAATTTAAVGSPISAGLTGGGGSGGSAFSPPSALDNNNGSSSMATTAPTPATHGDSGIGFTGGPTRGRHKIWYRGLPASLLKVVLYQILLFLKFAHARGLVHTDLKPENILFEASRSLPTQVPVFVRQYRCGGGDGGGGSGRAASPPCTSSSSPPPSTVEGRRMANDAHKLSSAMTRGNDMVAPFPAAPATSEEGQDEESHAAAGGVSWKHPPTINTSANHINTNNGTGSHPGAGPRRHSSPKRHHQPQQQQQQPVLAHTVTVSLPMLNSIRVMDLGAAQFAAAFTHRSYVDRVTLVSYDPIQTSHYRSPETLMGTGWNSSADIFSLGCMVPELHTGDCLFMPQDTLEHLAMMRHIIGPFWKPSTDSKNSKGGVDGSGGSGGVPEYQKLEKVFTINATTYRHYFDANSGELKWPVTEEVFKGHARQLAAQEAEKKRSGGGHTSANDDEDSLLCQLKTTDEEDTAFVTDKPTLRELFADQPLLLDLCQRMLRLNPLDRITASEALRHPFFHAS